MTELHLFDQYQSLAERGLKAQATEAVNAFIASFTSQEEVSEWVWSYLDGLDMSDNQFGLNMRLRHEIFRDLIFPTIKPGMLAGDIRSTLWVVKLFGNILGNSIHEEINFVHAETLLRNCYAKAPDAPEVQQPLAIELMSKLNFLFHEWSCGVVLCCENQRECENIRDDLRLVGKIDRADKYSKVIAQFSDWLDEFEARQFQPPKTTP